MKKLPTTIILSLLCLCFINAQTVTRNGNVFSEAQKTEQQKETPTEYIYQDSKGEQHLIYLSKTGKAFIWKTSKKTGKKYKHYIPEVGKQINPEAYKENADTKK